MMWSGAVLNELMILSMTVAGQSMVSGMGVVPHRQIVSGGWQLPAVARCGRR